VGNLRIHLAWAVVTLGAAGAWGRWCTPTAVPARAPQPMISEISASAPSTTTTITAAEPTPSTGATPLSTTPPGAPAFPAYTYEVLTVEQIRALIRSGTKKDGFRAMRALNKMSDPALRNELLKEMVTFKDEYVRQASLSMLMDRPLLQNAVKNDPSEWVRRNAALCLAKTGGDGTLEALLQAAQDQDLYVRVNVAAALARLGRPEAAADLVRSLEPSLTSPDDAVRHDAVENVVALKSPVAIPALVRALRDGNREIRDLGFWGLSDMDTPEVFAVLESLRQDPDARVTQAAKEILEQKARK
jgi:hypothetical protein